MMRSAKTAGMAFSAALMLLLLASPIHAHLPHQTRRRMTATATAVSNAVARDGATVVADSKATSTGAPATSVVNAQGSGDVEVVCRQSAKDNEDLYKECIDNNGKTSVPWDQAPACTKPASSYKVIFDNNKRPWGWEEDKKTSCALRDEKGNATA